MSYSSKFGELSFEKIQTESYSRMLPDKSAKFLCVVLHVWTNIDATRVRKKRLLLI